MFSHRHSSSLSVFSQLSAFCRSESWFVDVGIIWLLRVDGWILGFKIFFQLTADVRVRNWILEGNLSTLKTLESLKCNLGYWKNIYQLSLVLRFASLIFDLKKKTISFRDFRQLAVETLGIFESWQWHFGFSSASLNSRHFESWKF